MALLGDDFTGRIGHCPACQAPAVFVAGQPKATNPSDTIVRTMTKVRGVDMVTVTFHHSLCPYASPARSN